MLKNEFVARLTLIGLNQRSFAERIGVAYETVNRWLNSTILPQYAVLALKGLECEYHHGSNCND